MKRIEIKTTALALILMAGTAVAAEMDIYAEAPVRKPKAKVTVVAPAAKLAATKSSAVVAAPSLVGPSPAPTQWVQAMEASMSPLSTQSDPTATGTASPLVWLGWALATIFGCMFLAQVLSTRRKQLYLLRAGDRDSFWLPPSNRRRF